MVASALDVLPLAKAKAFLRLTTTQHDEELPDWIAAAVDAIGEACDETLVDKQVTEHRHAVGGQILLSHLPVARLVGIYQVEGGLSWGPPQLYPTEAGCVFAVAGAPALSGLLRVVYITGMDPVPARYGMAARTLLGRMWGKLRGTAGGPRPGGQPDLASEAAVLINAEILSLLGEPMDGFA